MQLLYIYIYIYMYIYTCVCIYIYIYIHKSGNTGPFALRPVSSSPPSASRSRLGPILAGEGTL